MSLRTNPIKCPTLRSCSCGHSVGAVDDRGGKSRGLYGRISYSVEGCGGEEHEIAGYEANYDWGKTSKYKPEKLDMGGGGGIILWRNVQNSHLSTYPPPPPTVFLITAFPWRFICHWSYGRNDRTKGNIVYDLLYDCTILSKAFNIIMLDVLKCDLSQNSI